VKGNGCNSSRAILLNAIERENHLTEDTRNMVVQEMEMMPLALSSTNAGILGGGVELSIEPC